MNKRLATLFSMVVLSLIFVAANSFAAARWDATDARTMIGHEIYSANASDPLGQISDLVIDQTNGHIALVILSDVPSFGAERIAVPYGSVFRTEENGFELRVPVDKIGFGTFGDANKSRYRMALEPGILPAKVDSSWVANLYREYDQQPYWTGERPDMVFYKSDSLLGAKVDLAQGDVARLDDLVFEASNGWGPLFAASA